MRDHKGDRYVYCFFLINHIFFLKTCGQPAVGMLCGSDPMNPHPSLSLYCLIGSQGKDLEALELTRNNNEGRYNVWKLVMTPLNRKIKSFGSLILFKIAHPLTCKKEASVFIRKDLSFHIEILSKSLYSRTTIKLKNAR